MREMPEYCSLCGASGPPEYFKEKDGLTLCPPCYNEHDLDYDMPFDLFKELAATKPEDNE